jgi:7,8-dihydroneopterin aldolase/epimerase/oxygenase
MGDRLELRGLRVLGHHGVTESERATAQPFEVDLDVEAALAAACVTDDLADTVDYALVVAKARSVVADGRFHLLEALANAVAEAVLEVPGVEAVEVAVRKLRPPVEADLCSAGVRLRREARRR